MEREGEEEHEGAERGVSLEVDVDVLATALPIRTCSISMSMSMSISMSMSMSMTITIYDFWYEGLPLLQRPSHLLIVQDNPLHNEDCEEAESHDKLWKRETGLFETNAEKVNQF